MKVNYKQSFLASTLAFLLATSCCWLPWLAIAIGGASGFAGLSAGLEQYSGLFFVLAVGLLSVGSYQFYKNKNAMSSPQAIILDSTITCPSCGHSKTEEMPTNACQFFYECEGCKEVLRPKAGDCCVYCSYGTVACPPIQLNKDCC